ncbi:hypothetical protein ACOI1C_13320 [Bacillus sp. DJP31]|uniref:hypothetical protein n=1 Tax=Bacillus sp. DJP31 TaxID=3409789 RepID=UPI003BB51A82
MKKWALSAVGYLLVVVIGYSIYAAVSSPSDSTASDDSHGGHGGASETEGEGYDSNGTASSNSTVNVQFEATSTEMNISLKDQEGNPVELQVNHEKLLHLIVVDEHLDQYFHLHPEEVEPGEFVMVKSLEEGTYKAFIDIKPRDLSYSVDPQTFTIGEEGESHGHTSLKTDTELSKTVNGVKVEFNPTSLKANEEITLSFVFPNGENLQPYLGAMGHVVILDEMGEKFVHVHPANEDETKFITEFAESGIFKLWAEFQIDGEVYTYPFTVEIE